MSIGMINDELGRLERWVEQNSSILHLKHRGRITPPHKSDDRLGTEDFVQLCSDIKMMVILQKATVENEPTLGSIPDRKEELVSTHMVDKVIFKIIDHEIRHIGLFEEKPFHSKEPYSLIESVDVYKTEANEIQLIPPKILGVLLKIKE